MACVLKKGILKYLLKLTGKTGASFLYWSLFLMKLHAIIKKRRRQRDLWVYHNFLETYCKENLRMGLSVARSTLHVLHKISQQARWLKGRNKMSVGGKKMRFILSNYSFKGRESSSIWIIQKNLLTFQCDVGCIPPPVCLWHVKKGITYAWIAPRWIVYRELAQPYCSIIQANQGQFTNVIWRRKTKGVFRTLSNNYDGAVKYFPKWPPSQMFDRILITLLQTSMIVF